MTWALREELASYRVDVCCWQAATVSTKMTNYSKGCMTVTPQAYASEALSKCTSGSHSGAFRHEVLKTLLLNVIDVLPINFLTKRFNAKKAADRVKAREEGNNKT